jgi:hypothetical protein
MHVSQDGYCEAIAPSARRERSSLSRGMLPRGSLLGAAILILSVAVVNLCVSGCASMMGETPIASVGPAAPAAFGRERLIGKWGVASFHDQTDRTRTESEAKAQCSQPYRIAKGPTDGVMMHVADDPKLYELRLKGTGSKTYLGFEAPPGDPQDREILSSTDEQITMRFVDPDVNGRYGTFVYVRCRA